MATSGKIGEVAVQKRLPKWWLPFSVALLSLIVGTLILVSGDFDLDEITYVFLAVPIISLLVAIWVITATTRSRRAPSLAVILILPVYWAVTLILFAYRLDVRFNVRWILRGGTYKASLMKQPKPRKGELRHLEWDGWGWAGMDTNVYLVFDPADSLAAPAARHSSGKFPGVPCAVPRVRKLESHWYAVEYYTSESWDECG
jgi:hypothetical protein